jgi:GxxExxY protein
VINEQYKYSEFTSKIIGCAMTVHKALGNGFQEAIYHRSLEIEMPIFYREEQIDTRSVDFLVDGVISVELKAITKLEVAHFAQATNYLEAFNLEVGLLINLRKKSLNFKKSNNKKIKSQQSRESNKSQFRQCYSNTPPIYI